LGKIAIVGKPNVGKSTLFNALTNKNKSLVLDLPGTTRDRVFEYASLGDKQALLIDTGGFENEGELAESINEQVKFAIDASDAVIVVFDATTPVSSADEEIFRYVKRSNKPYVCVVNKSDKKNREFFYDYYRFGDLIEISASHRKNLDKLKGVLSRFIEDEKKEEYDARVAIVGRSNVGKSSLLNAILRQNRSVVSDSVGTTTDSVDTPFEFEGKKYLLVDTAGIRRKSRTRSSLDKLSSIFSIFSIERADIVIFVIDASEGITSMDRQIGDLIVKKHKGVVIALNKWDLVERKTTVARYEKVLKESMPYLAFAPVVATSALEARNTVKVIRSLERVRRWCNTRIPTPKLNADLHRIIRQNAPFSKRGKEIKLKYITQVDVNPPHFVIFTNRPEEIEENYKRYVRNSIYKLYGFEGCAIKITYRTDKGDSDVPGDYQKN